jgi:hypothetical protein
MLTTLAVLLLAIARSNAIFYDTSGNEHVTFFPYNASAEVGVCCSGSDYCLDNGLCLDAAGDNIFTVQGCRFNTWEPPCKQYCPDLPRKFNIQFARPIRLVVTKLETEFTDVFWQRQRTGTRT